jgi:hypothetical protein
MGELRDKDIIRTRPLRVSPNFALPVDLDEGALLGRDADDDGTSSEGELVQTTEGEIVGDEGPKPPVPFKVELDPQPAHPPREMKVKSQTARFSPDGTYVIDVVLEFTDIPGATGYEVRIAQ